MIFSNIAPLTRLSGNQLHPLFWKNKITIIHPGINPPKKYFNRRQNADIFFHLKFSTKLNNLLSYKGF
jgi:hypothetical protein